MPRVAIGFVSALAVCAACYDWTIGPAASGASDAGPDADGAIDASAPRDAGADSASVDSSSVSDGGPPDTAPDCETLLGTVASDQAAAELCSAKPNDCMSTVKDQCGCTVFVAQSSSPATSAYLGAVQKLAQAGCVVGCGKCPTPPSQSLCLAGEQDGGVAEICTQE